MKKLIFWVCVIAATVTTVMVGCGNKGVEVVDATTGLITPTYRLLNRTSEYVTGYVYEIDGKWIILNSAGGTAIIEKSRHAAQ